MRPAALLLLCTAAAAVERPPHFTVDLDKPPAERWAGAVKLVLERHPYEFGFGPVFDEHNATLFKFFSAAQWETLGTALRTHFPVQAEEVHSLAAQFTAAGHPVSYEYLAGWVYYHALAHAYPMGENARACSGLIAQSKDGAVWHTANMDQTPEAARNVTLQVTFTRGGEVVMQGVDWYWFTGGVSRAVKKGVASVQENWRQVGMLRMADVLADISAGAVPHIYAFRNVLAPEDDQQVAKSFGEATQLFINQPLAAPYYVIAAGPDAGDGMIIAREPNATNNPPQGVLSLKDSKDGWFIAQSNYDHWTPDNEGDPRRTAAETLLRQVGQDEAASQLGLYAVASAFPVHNPHTAYTAVMSAKTGDFHAFVRRAMCPETTDLAWPFKDVRYCQGGQVRR